MYSDQQSIEICHLLFIKALEKKVEKSLCVLKEGCNLRFFFKSIRYSQDIDFDVRTIAKETLRKNVNQLLKSDAFQETLNSMDIEITHISEAKQSNTTQRWKLGFRTRNSSRILPTKIEFSRREMGEGIELASVDNQLIQEYKLYPILCNHYIKETALTQKINALIYRTETQARDIFDINLLLDKDIKFNNFKNQQEKINFSQAIENTISIQYSDYVGQVVSFLLPEYQEYYKAEKIWNDIQNSVINFLEKLSS